MGVVASTLTGNNAIAQNIEEVTVVGARSMPMERVVGGVPGGVTVKEISISYGISYKGLDLASSAGVAELKKRVKDAAVAACKEIGQQRAVASFTPSEADCAKIAADKALAKVDDLVAAAGKRTG
jgi:UrcA family protein